MKKSFYEDLLGSQQRIIDDLEFKVSFLESYLSNSAKRTLDELVKKRRETLNLFRDQRKDEAWLYAKQLENEEKAKNDEIPD